MKRRYDRRQLLVAGLGLCAAPSGLRADPAKSVEPVLPGAKADLAGAGAWAARALAKIRRSTFTASNEGVTYDLGEEGRLDVVPNGHGAIRVTLSGRRGELEILRALDTPGVGRVEARLTESATAPAGPGYDTLRRVPGGFELTFSSALALRHAAPHRVEGEPPVVYERLAARAVDGARTFLR